MKSTTTTGAFRWMVALCMVIILSAATLTAVYGQSATPVKDSQETRDEEGGGGPTLAPVPTGLSADSSTQTSVALSWDSLTNAQYYRLERREGVTGSWVIVSSYISGTSRTAYGLTCNTTHYFRISARGDGSPYTTSFGTASSSVSRATTTCPNATAPSGLSADSSNVNSVSLSWNSRTNAAAYKIERATTSTRSVDRNRLLHQR